MISFLSKIKDIFFSMFVFHFATLSISGLDSLQSPISLLAFEGVPQVMPIGPKKKPQPVFSDYQIGVFYMPGWQSGNIFWHDLLGTQHARYPGKSWPDRIPLLGTYPEEETWVKDWHIKWAVEHGISFFVYDWFWLNGKPHIEHAILAHLRSEYKDLLKFCVMWTNHEPFIPNMKDVPKVVKYWIKNYFNRPNYVLIDDKPMVLVFLPDRVGGHPDNAERAIAKIRKQVIRAGYKDIFLVAVSNDAPNQGIVSYFKNVGYDAYTPYNYASSRNDLKKASYKLLIRNYKQNWTAASKINALPYILSATPGWDSRPWHGNDAIVRTGNTPNAFKYKLKLAKRFLDMRQGSNIMPRMILIEAWNEFAEGSFIEPTKKWGFGYLDAIQEVFTNAPVDQAIETPVEIK